MTNNEFKIIIEGDYVDSYIYSGLLFLVDSNYILSVYKWEDIFEEALKGVNFFDSLSIKELIKDSRNKISTNGIDSITVAKDILNNHKLSSYEVGVWPTDINIFSNKLYIASEKGVQCLSLNYLTGELSGELTMFDEMVFTLSPNSHGRLAFAAGLSGVLSYTPFSKFFNRDNIKQIVSDTCLEVDWQSTTLFAETMSSIVRCDFKSMPSKSDFDSNREYFESVKGIKQIKPSINQLGYFKNAWVAGDKTFSITESGTVCSGSVLSQEYEEYPDIVITDKVLKARTAAFGTAIETDKGLFTLLNKEVTHYASEPISWRVFPRAKNYANQIHIIKEQHIELVVVESKPDEIFGFDVEKIDLRG